MRIISQIEAVDYLQAGKIIIFPTETCYGLGCDATNQSAVDRIFQIKDRRPDKPLLIVVPNIEMAKERLEWNDLLDSLAKKYWNNFSVGPLTVVGKVKIAKEYPPLVPPLNKGGKWGVLAKGVVAQDETVAVRVTNAEIPKYLSEQLGKPIVATSANISDAGEIYDSRELIKMYEDREFQPDAIIDAGVLPKNPPSTIVSVVDGELKVLRQGAVKVI